MPGVLVLGDLNVDVLMPVASYPAPGEETLGEGVAIRAGGSAANTAIVLARLGMDVRLISRVGQDPWGELAVQSLVACGVDCRLVQRDAQQATGLMFTPITPQGERTMFGLRGANSQLDPSLIDAESLQGMGWLHLSGYALLTSPQREAVWHAVELAEERRLPISLDTAWLPALTCPQQIRELLPHLELCILGLAEAQAILGGRSVEEAVSAIRDAGVSWVGLKLGEQGCLIAAGEERQYISAFPVQVLDTTGAGDAFSAGMIMGRMGGLSIGATGVLANALGGLAATTLGAGSALPGREQVRCFLHAQLGLVEGERATWIAETLGLLD